MPIKLKITQSVLKRFENIKAKCSGCLFGFIHQGTLIVLGFNIETTNSSIKSKQIEHNFPTNVDLCGFVKFGMLTDSEAHRDDILKDIDITDNPIMLTCDIGTIVGLKASLCKHGQFQEIPYDVIEEQELYQYYSMANLQCYLQVVCEETEESIKKNLADLRVNMASGSVAFCIKNTQIFLTSGNLGTNIHGINSESNVQDLINFLTPSTDEGGKGKKKNQQQAIRTEYEIIHVDALIKKTKDKTDENLNRSSGKITVDKTIVSKTIEIPLHINSLSMLYYETKSIDLYDVLVECVCSALRLIESNLIDQLKLKPEIPLKVLNSYHFYPEDLKHFFTCVYPLGINEDDPYLTAKRKRLHHFFGLPLSKPYFRRGNNVVFKKDLIKKPLINPHIGLKSKVTNGIQYLVTGKYSYHHYMQDDIDDSGWGCAYRSLQTLCSWFRWQGYCDRKIPTHLEIQKYLVEIGDKPATFVNSKQWIGSTEVSMCLNGFLNVDSKIMYVATGAELSQRGAELLMHFTTVGTPIMIGGGVLAHTILGIDYNQSTGDIKFLILDPHYTGGEDLNLIQSRGWCGWKGPEFWDKSAYYNLCMPQKPFIF